VRYLVLGYLTVKYGERASVYMRENGTTVSIIAVAAVGVGFGIFMLWRRLNKGRPKADRI